MPEAGGGRAIVKKWKRSLWMEVVTRGYAFDKTYQAVYALNWYIFMVCKLYRYNVDFLKGRLAGCVAESPGLRMRGHDLIRGHFLGSPRGSERAASPRGVPASPPIEQSKC